MSPSDNFSGNLSNAGEFVLITNKNGNKIFSFSFSDEAPWPAAADGEGYSLVSKAGDPTGDPNLADYWRRSMNKGGSPFADDPVSTSDEEHRMREWGDLNIYPNPTGGVIVVNVNEEINGLMKLRFTSATGTTVLVKDIEGTTVIDLSGEGLTPGIYTVTAEHGGVSYRTRLVYMPDK